MILKNILLILMIIQHTYFCKKSNEILYLEISKDTYNKLISKDSTIAFQYYIPFNIPWQITGTKEQTYKVNKNIVELTMKQQKLPMFDMYLKKDYTKYTAQDPLQLRLF